MNAIRRWLLVALFAFLARPAFAAPGAATLIAPSGNVVDSTLAFSWQAVPESTWYLFWLGKGTPTAFVMEQWYTAEQAGCTNGGTCTITIAPPLNAGSHVWFIRTWGAGVDGPWSTGKQFVATAPHWSAKLPAGRRFTLVLNDQAVLDNETGLVWERTPDVATIQWMYGQLNCQYANTGQRYGWRLPSVSELRSLLDSSQANPALPPGHPFVAVVSHFWTQTQAAHLPGQYYYVDFGYGSLGMASNTAAVMARC